MKVLRLAYLPPNKGLSTVPTYLHCVLLICDSIFCLVEWRTHTQSFESLKHVNYLTKGLNNIII